MKKQFFDSIPYPETDREHIRQMATDGVIVYVQRATSRLLHIALTGALKKNQLPLPKVVLGIHGKKKPDQEDFLLGRCLSLGQPAALFLKRPKTIFSREKSLLSRHIQTLVHLQRQMQKPIYLAPHLLVFRSKPPQFEPTTADLLFGTATEPTFLRALFRLLISRRFARWEICEPINVKEFIDKYPQLSDKALAQRLRFFMLRQFARVEQAFHGPPLKSYERLERETLRDPELHNYITQVNDQTGVPIHRLQKKCRRIYRELAARFDIDIVRLADKLLNLLWNRIYDGLFWDQDDIKKIRRASHNGPLILVPSHKSHVDYMVMSQLFYKEGLMPPHIAAGMNLVFFPFGYLARRGGAYFIRRSFRGDPLYPQVVKSYIKRLFKEGFTQEFFIEGTRSRSGKTLSPKTGLLGIMLEALLKGKPTNAVFLPVSISYEKLIEAKSFQHELKGGEKTTENATELARSVKVLKKKYGRVFVTFDEPIVLFDYLKERGFSPEQFSEQVDRDLVKSIAHRISYGINRCTQITAVSLVITALFCARRRTLARPLLMLYVRRLIKHIERDAEGHARFSHGFLSDIKTHVDRATTTLAADGLIHSDEMTTTVFYRIPEKTALSLDFYKNNTLHYFVPDAIVATAFLVGSTGRARAISEPALFAAARTLSQLFKFEFIFPAGRTFDDIFWERLKMAEEAGVVTHVGSYLQLRSSRSAHLQFDFCVRLIANFVDAYLVCARKLGSVVPKSSNKSALVLKLLEQIRAAYLGSIIDCPEAESRAMVENAIKTFEDAGILSWVGEKPQLKENAEEKLKSIKQTLQKAYYGRVAP